MEEMIRDRIVVGLLNAKQAEKLQLLADLTLVKAVNEARQSKQVKKQQVRLIRKLMLLITRPGRTTRVVIQTSLFLPSATGDQVAGKLG